MSNFKRIGDVTLDAEHISSGQVLNRHLAHGAVIETVWIHMKSGEAYIFDKEHEVREAKSLLDTILDPLQSHRC